MTPPPAFPLTEVITYAIRPIVVTRRRPAGASPLSGPPATVVRGKMPVLPARSKPLGSVLLTPSASKKGTHHVLCQVPPSDPAKPTGSWPSVESRPEKQPDLPNGPEPKAKGGERSQTNPTQLTILE